MPRKSLTVCLLILGFLFLGAWQATVCGQGFPNGSGYYPQAVGGISINAQGLLENAQPDAVGKLAKFRAETMRPIPQGMKEPAGLRKISLRGLDAALQECLEQKKPIPDDLFCLGGLQQIHYIFVYPEQHDIVLVGSGEGWKIDARGNIVGATTGRAVMLLDDLVVALRSARRAAQGGVLCSIEPTAEGRATYQKNSHLLQGLRGNLQAMRTSVENWLGPQEIKISGVPATSHFARVLVAADYRMKQIGLDLQPAPRSVKLPSYLQMAPANVSAPRFWLEPKYEPILRDEAGLAWELRGGEVRALTEQEFFNASGQKTGQVRANPVAEKWAKMMTQQYPELSVAEPIFGQLRNCMELAVVGALLTKEQLPEKAQQSLPTLLNSDELKPTESFAPKHVATQVNFLKKNRNLAVASGGVAINSWGIADRTERSAKLDPVRAKAAPRNESTWWWN